MRVFHGPQNIGGMAGVLARAQRELGCDAEAVCLPTGRSEFECDELLEPGGRGARLEWIFRNVLARQPRFDVYHFYFGESLDLDSLRDVPWLKRLGRRVFFYFCGCDIRDSKHVIATYEHSACKTCWPQLCSANRPRALEVARRFADGVFVSTPDLLEFVPGSTLLPQPIDLGRFDARGAAGFGPPSGTPGVDRPARIAHAPTNRGIKGSDRIEAAVRSVALSGLAVELVTVENRPHREVLEICATCDLAVDQLLIGAYGQFAVECMAMGKPTLCYIRPDLAAEYPAGCPIISASPADFETVLASTLAAHRSWPAIGRAGREYVERVHDARKVAAQCIAEYQRGEISCAS
jgi:hypothetical protein